MGGEEAFYKKLKYMKNNQENWNRNKYRNKRHHRALALTFK